MIRIQPRRSKSTSIRIKDSCKWLGHEPTKITYSSDYFDRLYELAIQLIKSGRGVRVPSNENRDGEE